MLNPILFTENVIGDFLKYQLTTYAFADPDLYAQMRRLLNLDETRHTPLLKGPYISLSRAFRQGPPVEQLVSEGILHPHLKNLIPHPTVYGHQEAAFRSIKQGRTTLVSTGTGSGKTECFLYPIISRCLELKDRNEPAGIAAVILYPMNALAEDQLGRLRELLAGSGITFGMYVGKTPELDREVAGERLPAGSSRADFQARLAQAREAKETHAIHPPEERVSREEMRTPGKQPRILLTNVKQLELLLTRQQDVELFDGARLDFLVFDEAHTFKGAAGAETACLIRRLRAFCGRRSDDTICVATSATLADPERGTDAAKEFAARFFGIQANNVEVVLEQYVEDDWATQRRVPRPLPGDPREHLKNVLEAVESGDDAGALVRIALRAMTGDALAEDDWQEDLYNRLAANELVYQIAQALRHPRKLDDLLKDLSERVSRAVLEEELLAWLALGSAARKQGRPLLRPVVHGFARGVEGAVVTFPKDQERPRLWLSVEDVQEAAQKNQQQYHPLPVTSCTTCGQHYFTLHVKDFEFTGQRPGGGDAVGEGRVWQPLDLHLGGKRVVLLDRLITEEVEDDGGGEEGEAQQVAPIPPSCGEIWMCRACGTLHGQPDARCGHCGSQVPMVRLLAVRQRDNWPGKLTRCVSCAATGRDRWGDYREPARPVRASHVSDVHVLALSMLQHSDHKRLLVFSDNRQDAAFQAGWMQDHARRFRLRSLMYERLVQGAVSVGDLSAHLCDRLEQSDDLSRALIPEVWRVHRKEAEGVRHQEERARFIRIQVLRELTMGVKQRIGLEPWGRLKVTYRGLTADVPFVREWAKRIKVEPPVLAEGIAGLLDIFRRNSILLDREGHIFSRFWGDGELEIQRGYLVVSPGVPKALKLRRAAEDDKGRLSQILSERGDTIPRQAAKRWGVPEEFIDAFYEALWRVLTEELGILVPVTLTGFRNRPLPNCTGAYQIDADILRLEQHHGVYRCNTCRRRHLRPTPGNACLAWRCNDGHTELVEESPDDFNLMVLDQKFLMLQPREHSGQVPAADREQLERDFKSEGNRVNTLVCTPTLELGVDIGVLDSVLMRNVPPLTSNYWQRVGRAGRRHRMAVNLTYARTVSHDRAYFKEPLKLLQGVVSPPRFNLRNGIMLEKHIHATILTTLQALARGRESLGASDREEIKTVLQTCFPRQIKDYLFSPDGSLRPQPLDVGALGTVVGKHQALLLQNIKQVFAQGWPAEDAVVVGDQQLDGYVAGTSDRLQEVIKRLWRRLLWAREQLNRLTEIRNQQGTLEPDQDALWGRCDRFIKKLKGLAPRRRRETEGIDETNTYSVLSSEGFLPGYGLEVGAVTGFALVPRNQVGLSDFDLPRVSSVAVREYVPGNLIYANGNRFLPRYYHLDLQGVQDQVRLQVDIENQAVAEFGGNAEAAGVGLGAKAIRAVPICDVDLAHQSHITDEEYYRFQMAVSVFGKEQDRHGEGNAFHWGSKQVSLRRSVHLRLVNVGPTSKVQRGELGYPVCLVCGQSRSPLASQADQENFRKEHAERCHQNVEPTGFFADIVADALTLHVCNGREEAYSVGEALRMGASRVLDMEIDDLQLVCIARPGSEEVDVLLYDPMPGGSGLLDQVVAHWAEVVAEAKDLVEHCPSACASSCIDCLQTFRNAFYHKYLNRLEALRCFQDWGDALQFSHDIPPKQAAAGAEPTGSPGNEKEQMLRDMLLRAGFVAPVMNREIDLGRPHPKTYPDVFFEVPDGRKEGVCLYLDGMSGRLHGNPQTAQQDRQIRELLRNENYEVIEVPVGNLDDREAMRRHFYRIGAVLLGKEQAVRIRDNPDWHSGSPASQPAPENENADQQGKA